LWTPAHGHFFNLSPSDMGDLTPAQLDDVNKELKQINDESRKNR